MNGILFNRWKLKAIAESGDREWQTRRVIKPQPVHVEVCCGEATLYKDANNEIAWKYRIGEVVYIKEAWCPLIAPVYNLLDPTIPTVYKQEMDEGGAVLPKEFKWKSPRSMPEWAARLFIKITDVRAERLQEITEEDCIAEGMKQQELPYDIAPVWQYRDIWNSINAKWKRVWNKRLRIYEFWQFPWSEEDAVPIPKSTQRPERYHCVPNPWVWLHTFKAKNIKPQVEGE